MSPDEQTNNNYGYIQYKFHINLGAKRKGAERPELLVSYIGFPCLCFGVILSILKIWRNFLVIIICFVRWAIRGAIIGFVFFSFFIDMLSCPIEFLLFDLVMIFAISVTLGIGISKVVSALGYIFFRISIGDTGTFGICSLIFIIYSM